MKMFLTTACGAATGSLLYSAFISKAQELDWGRAVCLGLAIGLASLLWPRKKKQAQ